MNIVVDNGNSVLNDFCNTESKSAVLRIVEKDVLTETRRNAPCFSCGENVNEDVIISDANIRNSANFCVGIWD